MSSSNSDTGQSDNSSDNTNSSSSSEEEVEPFYTGVLLAKRYICIKLLGSGTFSKVWMCYCIITKQFYAIKLQTDEYQEQVELEIKCLKKIKKNNSKYGNKYINNIINDFKIEIDENIYYGIVTELLGKSLDQVLEQPRYKKGIEYKLVRKIMYQIIHGVKSINQSGFIHTDLKPDNILLTQLDSKDTKIIREIKKIKHKKIISDPEKYIIPIVENAELYQNNDNQELDYQSLSIKITDFGGYRDITEKEVYNVQTRGYRAPEITLHYLFNKQCDVWSIGCIQSELLLGNNLFSQSGNDKKDLNKNFFIKLITAIGPVPNNMITSYGNFYFRKDGTLKTFGQLSHDPLYKKFINDNSIKKADYYQFINLMLKCLMIDPNSRYTIDQCIKDISFINFQ
jgi:serine/threonine protein kinase